MHHFFHTYYATFLIIVLWVVVIYFNTSSERKQLRERGKGKVRWIHSDWTNNNYEHAEN